MTCAGIVALIAILGLPQIAGVERRDQVAVMPLTSTAVERNVLAALDSTLVNVLDRLGPFEVISPVEVSAQLGMEAMKDALGCDQVRCAAEIAGALGTTFIVAGTVNRLGGTLRVSVSLIDTRKGAVRARGEGKVGDEPRLYDGAVELAVRKLLRLPPPANSELRFEPQAPPSLATPRVDAASFPAGSAVPTSLDELNIDLERAFEHALDEQEREGAGPMDIAGAWCAVRRARNGGRARRTRAAAWRPPSRAERCKTVESTAGAQSRPPATAAPWLPIRIAGRPCGATTRAGARCTTETAWPTAPATAPRASDAPTWASARPPGCRCVVGDVADCRQSKACKAHRYCRLGSLHGSPICVR